MYNFNTTEKVLKNISKINKGGSQYQLIKNKGVISPYCEGACCQMINSSSIIPMTANNKIGLSGNTLPFLKEECSHFGDNSNKSRSTNKSIKYSNNNNGLFSNNAIFQNNNYFVPINRLYGTYSKNQNHTYGHNGNDEEYFKNTNFKNINPKSFLYKTTPSTSIKESFINNNYNTKAKIKTTTYSQLKNNNYNNNNNNNNNKNKNKNNYGENLNNNNRQFKDSLKLYNNNNNNLNKNINNNYFGTSSDKFQNCVKFESPKSNYVFELVEGILPKDLVSDSRVLTPTEPHCAFVNFSSAVKAYQAHEYVTEWSGKNLPSLKSFLIRNSLDPLHSIEKNKIETVYIQNQNILNSNNNNNINNTITNNLNLNNININRIEDNNQLIFDNLPEYPVPNFKLIKSNTPSTQTIIQEKLLKGEKISNFNENNQLVLSIDIEYIHKNDSPESHDYYALTLSNGDYTIIFDLKSIGENNLPDLLIDILNSNNIKKVGFNNLKNQTNLFENQYNLKINNYEDLSKNPLILRSKPRNLISVVAIFLKYKLPRLELNRFSNYHYQNHNSLNETNDIVGSQQSNLLFSEKKIEHYAQITDSIHSLSNILKSHQPDFHLSIGVDEDFTEAGSNTTTS